MRATQPSARASPPKARGLRAGCGDAAGPFSLPRDLLAALDDVLLVDRCLVRLPLAAVDRLLDAVGGVDRVVAGAALVGVGAAAAEQLVVAGGRRRGGGQPGRLPAGVSEQGVVALEAEDGVVAGKPADP